VGELAVLGDLVGPVAEAVDVHRHRQPGPLHHACLVADHVRRELVDDEQLLGQLVLLDDRRHVSRDLVDLRRRDRADHRAGLGARGVPLGIERDPDVGLAQPAVEVPDLVEEVRVAGLDVEHEQRLGAACRAQVAADDRVALAGAVGAVLARVRIGHRGDELHRGQHRPRLLHVVARLAAQPAAGGVRRADAERAELVALRGAVERHDTEVREQPAAAARQLDRLGHLRRRGLGTARRGTLVVAVAGAREGADEGGRSAHHGERGEAATAVDSRGVLHPGRHSRVQLCPASGRPNPTRPRRSHA
jgi:hypothetical protein